VSTEQIDVVQLVRDGAARYEWHWIESEHNGLRLRIAVMRDAMKFDAMPTLDWYRRPVESSDPEGDTDQLYNGVRLPASADELQQIADLVGGILLTPRVIDLIWLQAGLKFDAIVNSGSPDYDIVAELDITALHQLIEDKIDTLGGDDRSQLVSCVGKYWCLINELEYKGNVQGDWAACNYGWCAKTASGPGLTPGVQCWQRPGYQHNKLHLDPSQTIRLMHSQSYLSKDDGKTWQSIPLSGVAADGELAPLIAWDGKVLKYLRQKGVDEQSQVDVVSLPPVETPAEAVGGAIASAAKAVGGNTDPKAEPNS
jgi:hypothetical protein